MSTFRSLAVFVSLLSLLASVQLLTLPARFANAQSLGSSTSGELTAVRVTESFASTYGARCMDGSTYTYYLHRSTTQATATSWVFYLQGGGTCDSPSSCKQRSETALGSSAQYGAFLTDDTNVASTKASVNPQFYNWNIVYMPYCSGESWIGSATSNKTNSQYPFYFAGHNITLATIQHLKNTQGFATATNIVVSGTSAGGVGTVNNVDYFAAAVPAALTVGYPQAGWFTVGQTYPQWLEAPCKGSATCTVPRPYYDSLFFGPIVTVFRPVYNPACYQHYVVALKQPINVTLCISVPILYNYIKSPIFVLENKFDSYQLNNFNQLPSPTTANHNTVLNYFSYFGTQMIRSITADVASKGNHTDGYFVPACFQHPTYPTSTATYNGTINGQMAYSVFRGWYTQLAEGTLTAKTAAAYQLTDSTHTLPLAVCSQTARYSS